MRAILVSVDYADLLAVTLPYNRHHFDQVCLVTDGRSYDGVRRVVDGLGPAANQVYVFVTEHFTHGGAAFNKWAALEEALDWFGRAGWLCLMDADVLWPQALKWSIYADGSSLQLEQGGREWVWSPGHLIAPLRRMYPLPVPFSLPQEHDWGRFPLHRDQSEWAGYSQIFHASDPVLGPPPWHDTTWAHCGGADSFFQRKWPDADKVRPPFEVLHLGEAGANWYGRATPFLDGTVPAGAKEKLERTATLWRERHRRRREGLDPFAPEKLPPPPV